MASNSSSIQKIWKKKRLYPKVKNATMCVSNCIGFILPQFVMGIMVG